MPSTLASVTMAPRSPPTGSWSSMRAVACLMTWNVPVRLTSSTCAQVAGVEQVGGPAAGDARGVDDAVEAAVDLADEGGDGGFVGDVELGRGGHGVVGAGRSATSAPTTWRSRRAGVGRSPARSPMRSR